MIQRLNILAGKALGLPQSNRHSCTITSGSLACLCPRKIACHHQTLNLERGTLVGTLAKARHIHCVWIKVGSLENFHLFLGSGGIVVVSVVAASGLLRRWRMASLSKGPKYPGEIIGRGVNRWLFGKLFRVTWEAFCGFLYLVKDSHSESAFLKSELGNLDLPLS